MPTVNFLPRELSQVVLDSDGRVKYIIAYINGNKIFFDVENGKPKRKISQNFPFFEIPNYLIGPLYKQINAVIYSYEKKAEAAKDLKKVYWNENLNKFGIRILPDGMVSVPYWVTDCAGNRTIEPRIAKDINAAIRMQDHIIKGYTLQKNNMENNSQVAEELFCLLEKLKVIEPRIEMRRTVLIYAVKQMEASIHKACQYLEKIMPDDGLAKEKSFGLPGKISRLITYLKNQWANPYLNKVDRTISLLDCARQAAAKSELKMTKLFLNKAGKILSLAINTKQDDSLEKISDIDPVKTLTQIHLQGKTNEVMKTANKIPGGRTIYNLLKISKMILAGKNINEPAEQISLNLGG